MKEMAQMKSWCESADDRIVYTKVPRWIKGVPAFSQEELTISGNGGQGGVIDGCGMVALEGCFRLKNNMGQQICVESSEAKQIYEDWDLFHQVVPLLTPCTLSKTTNTSRMKKSVVYKCDDLTVMYKDLYVCRFVFHSSSLRSAYLSKFLVSMAPMYNIVIVCRVMVNIDLTILL